MKVFEGQKFQSFQLPTLNSMTHIMSEMTDLKAMTQEEFNNIQIFTDPRKLIIVE